MTFLNNVSKLNPKLSLLSHQGDPYGEQALDRLDAIISHPRSLARASAAWRPPVVSLPPTAGVPGLKVALRRYRVGPDMRAEFQQHGTERTPAYVIEARFSNAEGKNVRTRDCEWWIGRLLDCPFEFTVHQLVGESSPTYCWVVDAHYRPMFSAADALRKTQPAA